MALANSSRTMNSTGLNKTVKKKASKAALPTAVRRAALPKKSARPSANLAALAAAKSDSKIAMPKVSLKAPKSVAKSTLGKAVGGKARTTQGKTARVTSGRARMNPVASDIAEAMFGEMMGGEESQVAREAARGQKERGLLSRLAISMNRSDEMPNLELASDIVFNLDEDSVSILVSVLERHDDVHAPDAARVLAEVGARDMSLVLPMADRLIGLCEDNHLEMMSCTMTAIAPMAHKYAEQLWDRRDLFWTTLTATTPQSEMAQAGAVRLLSALCAAGPDYARTLAGGLVDLLGKCMPKDVAFFAESVLPALGSAHSHRAKPVLDRRMKELTPAEVARLRRAVRAAQTGQPFYAAA